MKDEFKITTTNKITGGLFIEPIKLKHDFPTAFRFAKYPDGRKILQAGYYWSVGTETGFTWKDVPMVDVDENGQEI